MTPDLIQKILDASSPHELFGEVSGSVRAGQMRVLRAKFYPLARAAHPDRHPNEPRAQDAMTKLLAFYERAKQQIQMGRYGEADEIVLKTKRAEYRVSLTPRWRGSGTAYHEAEYGSTDRAVVRVALHPSANQGLQNEARVLDSILAKKDPHVTDNAMYLPALLDTLGIKQGSVIRQANVFAAPDPKLYSLADVRKAYRGGVDPKDAAWMFRRILFAASIAHAGGFVHAAILPQHVLIQPEQRGLVLLDWRHAQPINATLRSIPKGSRTWYPPTLEKTSKATTALDLWLAVRCFEYLLVDPPPRFRTFIRGALLTWSGPSSALGLLAEFDDLIGRMWGKRTFRPFSMTPA